MAGGMHGRAMHVRGHVWQEGMHGRGHARMGGLGACMTGWHVWQGHAWHGGHEWQGGMCSRGMIGGRHMWWGGGCVHGGGMHSCFQ